MLEYFKSLSYNLIYMDESGFMGDMPREYGYSSKGEKIQCHREYYVTKRTNFIGALFRKKIIAPMLTENNVDSDVFYTWIKKCLLPDLKGIKGKNILIMDNASFHKRDDIVNPFYL